MDNNAFLYNTIQYDLANMDEEDQSVESSDLEEIPQQPQPVRQYIHQEQPQYQIPIQSIHKRLLETNVVS